MSTSRRHLSFRPLLATLRSTSTISFSKIFYHHHFSNITIVSILPEQYYELFYIIKVYYRPQRSWGKVIFSQASVILLTGGGVCSREVSAPEGLLLGGCLLRGGSVPGGVCAWWRPPGTATAAGGTHPTGMHSCLHCAKGNTKVNFSLIFVAPRCENYI